MWDVAPEIADFAIKAAYFGFQQLDFPSNGEIPLAETVLVKWFDELDGSIAIYDQHKNHIWLHVKSHVGNPDEIIRSLGHEIYHAFQWAKGWPTTHEPAEFNGEHLLVKWSERAAALETKAREAEAKAAALAAKAFRRHFPGSSFDPPFNSHADVDWESRRPRAARAEYGFEREVEVKYVQPWRGRTDASPAEAAWHRLETWATDLYGLVRRLNAGDASTWQESGWYDRLAALYSGDLGPGAGGTLSPSMGRQASISSGLADLWCRFDELISLEQQCGDQLAMYQAAGGIPTSADVQRLLPPRPAKQTLVGSTSS